MYKNFLSLFVIIVTLAACNQRGNRSTATEPENTLHSYFVSGFSSLQQINYAVDDQLNLHVSRRVRLELEPQVIGSTATADASDECEAQWGEACGRPALKPLRSGRYKFRYAVVRNDYEETEAASQLVTAGEQDVDVVSGHMVTDIDVAWADLRLLGSRNRLLIELSPVKSKSTFTAQVFESALDGMANARLIFAPFDLKTLEPALRQQYAQYRPFLREVPDSPVNINSLADLVRIAGDHTRLAQEMAKTLKDNFVTTQNLIPWPAEEPRRSGIARADLMRVMKEQKVGGELFGSLCRMWMDTLLPDLAREHFQKRVATDEINFMSACMASHEKGLSRYAFMRSLGMKYIPFFVFQNVILTDKARLKRLEPSGRNFAMQVGERFYVRSRSEYNFEAGLRPLSWIPVVGPYLSLAGLLSVDRSLKQDSGNEMRFTTNMQVNVEENAMTLELKDYHRCLIVRMNPEWVDDRTTADFLAPAPSDLERDQMRRAMSERGLLLCGPLENQPLEEVEKYFYLSSGKDSGVQQDPMDLRNRQVALSLRGERDLQAFIMAGKSRLTWADSTRADYSGRALWEDGTDNAIAAVTPAIPGVFLERVFY